MWIWICIGMLAIMQCITAGALMSVLRRNHRLDDHQEPSKYITLLEERYDEYLVEVVQHLNHTHGIPLMKQEVADSRLVDYIVNSFVNNIPPETCSYSIIYVVDELVERAESD